MGSILIILPTTWYGLKYFWQSKTKSLYEEVQKNYSLRYAYVSFSNNIDQSLYAENELEAEKLFKYYSKLIEYKKKVDLGEIEKNKEYNIITGDTGYISPIPIPVPVKYIGVETPVYIEDINNTDLIVKVYVFNTKCWGYIEAYLPKIVIHDNLPQDSLLHRFKSHLGKFPEQKGIIYGKPSPYGFYCN